MVGPREAEAIRLLLPATPTTGLMYGRVRGAMAFTRPAGTTYPRICGANTYLEEQNTYGAGGTYHKLAANPPRQYQIGGMGAQPT
jgi:hypothetical protein